MLDKETVSKLLGRTLTSDEVSSFDQNINIAIERLELILGLSFSDDGGSRRYPARYGYSSVYIDPCTVANSVKVDGVVVTDYVPKQNERYNGDWYNIIEFNRVTTGHLVEVDASWGFDEVPYDLQMLLAQTYNQVIIEKSTDSNVKSKSIEGFNVTYKDQATFDEFIGANQVTIAKYSQRNVGNTQ